MGHKEVEVFGCIGFVFAYRYWISKTCKQAADTGNSYTKAVRNFTDIYTRIPRATGLRGKVYISAKSQYSRGISDIYYSGHTHLIGERTTDHSPHLFYTLASDDRLLFQLHGQIALRTLFLCHYVSETFDCAISIFGV